MHIVLTARCYCIAFQDVHSKPHRSAIVLKNDHRGNEPIARPVKYPVKLLHGLIHGVLSPPGRCPLSREETSDFTEGRKTQIRNSRVGKDPEKRNHVREVQP